MDLSRIKGLIDLVASRPIAELELSENGTRIRLVKAVGAAPVPSAAASAPAAPQPVAPSPPPTPAEPVVAAPMPGVFHRASAPGQAPFVAEGDAVTQGQTLCIIEAMKVFNAVTADRAGRIAAILAANGEMVQAGQPLFRIG